MGHVLTEFVEKDELLETVKVNLLWITLSLWNKAQVIGTRHVLSFLDLNGALIRGTI